MPKKSRTAELGTALAAVIQQRDHSYNVLFTDDEFNELKALSSAKRTPMSITVRNAIHSAYMMHMRAVPLCATGQACLAPQMHAPPPAPQQPKEPEALEFL